LTGIRPVRSPSMLSHSAAGDAFTPAAHSRAEYAPGSKTIEDATRIRAKILTGFERAEKATLEAEIRKFMTFVVVGGGPTGVELAGSIAEIAHSVLVRDLGK
jgi:NADH dehydrogenase FAD-containing subunit